MNISPFCQNAPKSRGTMFDGVARGMLPAPSMRTCCAGGGGAHHTPLTRRASGGQGYVQQNSTTERPFFTAGQKALHLQQLKIHQIKGAHAQA